MKMKALLVFAVLSYAGLSVSGCGLGTGGPSGTVRQFYQYIEAEKLDEAISLFSRTAKNGVSEDKLKAAMAIPMQMAKASGGIRSIKFVKEEINGDKAQVTVEVTFGNGETSTDTIDLVREDGVWKLDPTK